MTKGEKYWYDRAVAAEKRLRGMELHYTYRQVGNGPCMRPCHHLTYTHWVVDECQQS